MRLRRSGQWRNIVRHFWLVLSIGVITLCSVSTARAQNDPNFETGFKPFGSYNGGNIDHVNLVNGALNVDIPLMSYPQQGGRLKLSFTLHYDNLGDYSNEVTGITPGGTHYHYWEDWGGTEELKHGFTVIQDGLPTGVVTVETPFNENNFSYIVNSQLELPDGSEHLLLPASQDGSVWLTADGTGYRVTSAGIFDADGILYGTGSGSAQARDPNNNQIVLTQSGWTDSLQRPIPAQVATTDFSGCTGPLQVASATIWNLPSYNGGTYPIKFCYVSVTETDPIGGENFDGLSGPSANTYTATDLQSIVLVNSGQAWTFVYSGDGNNDLAQITFPTGGTLSYSWTNAPVQQTESNIFNRAVASRRLDPNDGVNPSGTWTYCYASSGGCSGGFFSGQTTVTDPLGNDTVHNFALLGTGAWYENQAIFYQGSKTNNTILKTNATTYSTSNPDASHWPYSSTPALNVFATSVSTTWPTQQESQVQHDADNAATFYSPYIFEPSGQVDMNDSQAFGGNYGDTVATREYDYGNGTPGPLLRTTSTYYLALSNPSYLANNLLKLPSQIQVSGVGPGSLTSFVYDETGQSPGGYLGNLTHQNRWVNTTGSWLSTSFAVNSNGLTTNTTDPFTNQTQYGYAGYGGSGPTTVTNALNQTVNYEYDFNTGLKISSADPNDQANNRATSYGYDSMLRLSSVNYPDQGNSAYIYDTATQFHVMEAIDGLGHYRTSYGLVDGLGRESRRAISNGEMLPFDQIDTCYDALGRVAFKSYAYQGSGFSTSITCSGSTHTGNGDSYQYDPLGRTTAIIHSDGSTVSSSYSGNCTTIQDEALKKRQTCTDGLGRLGQVTEDPGNANYLTTYSYDALDNLTSVSQGGSRNRSFVYDSLSRLTSATNPESGGTTYVYTALNGGLCAGDPSLVCQRTDARGVTATSQYDTVNRLKMTAYSDGTPTDYYYYDQTAPWGYTLSNPIGRLTTEGTYNGTSWVTAAAFSYDPMGRIASDNQSVANINKLTGYTYNLLGSVASITYPSGNTIVFQSAQQPFNAGNRPTLVSDNTNSINYVSNAHYTAWGVLCSLVYGSNVTATFTFNSRMQPQQLHATTSGAPGSPCGSPGQTGTILDMSYDFNSGADNGNVMSITNNRDGTRSQSFGYDSLNRIQFAHTSATSGGNAWGESYSIDQWSNLYAIGTYGSYPAGESLNIGVGGISSANQLPGALGFQYDLAGNMTHDGSHAYTFNAKNQIVQTDGGTATYIYDAEGRRVQKSPGLIYWLDTGGEVLDESDTSGNIQNEYIYFSGKRIARRAISAP